MTHNTVTSGLRQPVMRITRDAETMRKEGWSQKAIDQHQKTIWTVSDSPFEHAGRIDWRRAHAITNVYTLAFFNKHVQDISDDLLEAAAGSTRK